MQERQKSTPIEEILGPIDLFPLSAGDEGEIQINWPETFRVAQGYVIGDFDKLTAELLPFLGNDNQSGEIRAVAMLMWFHLNPTTDEQQRRHFEMAKQQLSDKNMWVALWAAAVVAKHSRFIEGKPSPLPSLARIELRPFRRRLIDMYLGVNAEQWKNAVAIVGRLVENDFFDKFVIGKRK